MLVERKSGGDGDGKRERALQRMVLDRGKGRSELLEGGSGLSDLVLKSHILKLHVKGYSTHGIYRQLLRVYGDELRERGFSVRDVYKVLEGSVDELEESRGRFKDVLRIRHSNRLEYLLDALMDRLVRQFEEGGLGDDKAFRRTRDSGGEALSLNDVNKLISRITSLIERSAALWGLNQSEVKAPSGGGGITINFGFVPDESGYPKPYDVNAVIDVKDGKVEVRSPDSGKVIEGEVADVG